MQYKKYLFSNQGVLKATDEGILGPEVAFMGKSIPDVDGIAPAVAGSSVLQLAHVAGSSAF